MSPPHIEGHEHASSEREAIAETAHDEGTIGPAPDGGREAWLAVLAGFLQQFCVFGLMSSNGNLQTYYLQHQLSTHSKSQVAWFGSVQTLLEFGLSLFTGRYFDIHGGKLLVGSATITGFVAIIGMAFSTQYYQFFLSFVLYGFTGSLIYAPSGAVAAHWFDKRRGLAIGIVVCGTSVGGLIFPIMMEHLFARMSYRNAMLIIGGFNFVLMAPGVFLMKTRLSPRRPPPFSDLKGPWRDPRYVIHVVAAMIYGMNILSPYFTAIDLATANNLPTRISDYSVTILMAGSIVGRILFGFIADLVGVWTVFGCVGFSSAIVMFGFWLPTMNGGGGGVAMTMIGLVGYGMISGAWFALVPAATAAISPVHETGMRFGMLISSLAIPSLVGPVVTSALIEKANDKMVYAAAWCGACFALSGLVTNMIPFSRWWKRRAEDKATVVSVDSGQPEWEAGRGEGGGDEEKPSGRVVVEAA